MNMHPTYLKADAATADRQARLKAMQASFQHRLAMRLLPASILLALAGLIALALMVLRGY